MGIVAESLPADGSDPAAALVKEMTGVEVPSYYSQGSINPVKYADQVAFNHCLFSHGLDQGS